MILSMRLGFIAHCDSQKQAAVSEETATVHAGSLLRHNDRSAENLNGREFFKSPPPPKWRRVHAGFLGRTRPLGV